MRNIGTACLGCTAALLLTAPLRAEGPAKGDSTGTRVAQSDRPRGFFGFPDWDSRSGGYDRTRRADEDNDKDKDRGSGDGARDRGRGGFHGGPPFGPGGFGRGLGPGRGGPMRGGRPPRRSRPP